MAVAVVSDGNSAVNSVGKIPVALLKFRPRFGAQKVREIATQNVIFN
jgi:hypothetical protein